MLQGLTPRLVALAQVLGLTKPVARLPVAASRVTSKQGRKETRFTTLPSMHWLPSAKADAFQPASTRSLLTWQAQQKNCTQILKPRF